MTRNELLRMIPGREMQTMRTIPGDLSKVKCFCCAQTLDIHEASKKFYDDFKGSLQCDVCAREDLLDSPESLATYFSAGFPQCCGKTMTWKTQFELEQDLP